MKKLIPLLVLSGLLALASYLFVTWKNQGNIITNNKDTDEDGIVHGCNVSTGYSIDETIGACTISGELDNEEKEAAKTAVQKLRLSPNFDTSKAIYVLGVEVLRCPNCYEVTLDIGEYFLYKIPVINGIAGDIKEFAKLDDKMPIEFQPYQCPEEKWVDCMPGTDKVNKMCSPEFLKWATDNCPGFEGAAY